MFEKFENSESQMSVIYLVHSVKVDKKNEKNVGWISRGKIILPHVVFFIQYWRQIIQIAWQLSIADFTEKDRFNEIPTNV